jgi:signal transduction histidine kinase
MGVTTRHQAAADVAIAQYGVLDQRVDDLQGLVDLAALVCGVPNAAVNLITRDHQHQVATAGIDPSVCAREDSMCAIVLGDARVVVTPDAREDERFARNAFVTGELGSVRFYSSAPLVTPAGTTIGRLCVFDDVPHQLTDQGAHVLEVLAGQVVGVLELRLRSRQLEESLEELTRTRDELHRSNEMLSLFAGQISHDLRSPLTAIVANAELLATEPLLEQDADVRGLAEATLAAGHRMGVLIDKILAYTRVGADLELDDVELDDVLDDVLADLEPTLRERDASVSRGALPRVRGDRQQLYAVLLNLLSNAVKFTPLTERPTLDVRAEEERGSWRVSVSDNGRGIPAEDREALFELYRRGTRSVAGSGIGLATARRAVEAHGGTIGIDGTAGAGTTVWFTLPE